MLKVRWADARFTLFSSVPVGFEVVIRNAVDQPAGSVLLVLFRVMCCSVQCGVPAPVVANVCEYKTRLVVLPSISNPLAESVEGS